MEYKLEKETALVEAILFLESEPLSEEAISIIGQLSKDVVDIALENLKERNKKQKERLAAIKELDL
mgnify:CR=1 FL=1